MKILNSNKLTTGQVKTIIGVLFFLTLLVLHNNVLSLHVASLRASQQYKKATSDRIRTEKIVANKLKAKKVQLRKLLEEHEVRERVLFNEEEGEEFFKTLEATCFEAGCEVASVDYSLAKRDDAITTVDGDCIIFCRSAGLEVLGRYDEIIHLVGALDSKSHKVWLDTFHLSDNRSEDGVIRCHITLTIFVIQQKENTGDEEVMP